MSKPLENQVALVTGVGWGPGKAIAAALAAQGASVVVQDADKARADAVAAEMSGKGARVVAAAEPSDTVAGGEQLVKTAVEKFGRLDVLVNNAGRISDRPIARMDEGDWDKVIQIQLKSLFCCGRPAANVFRQQRSGRIINITSTSGLFGAANQANHAAATSGIVGFTKAVARDMGRYAVTTNAIAVAPEALRGQAVDFSTLAALVVFLLGPDGSNVNGQTFHVTADTVQVIAPPRPSRSISKDGRWTQRELVEHAPHLFASSK